MWVSPHQFLDPWQASPMELSRHTPHYWSWPAAWLPAPLQMPTKDPKWEAWRFFNTQNHDFAGKLRIFWTIDWLKGKNLERKLAGFYPLVVSREIWNNSRSKTVILPWAMGASQHRRKWPQIRWACRMCAPPKLKKQDHAGGFWRSRKCAKPYLLHGSSGDFSVLLGFKLLHFSLLRRPSATVWFKLSSWRSSPYLGPKWYCIQGSQPSKHVKTTINSVWNKPVAATPTMFSWKTLLFWQGSVRCGKNQYEYTLVGKSSGMCSNSKLEFHQSNSPKGFVFLSSHDNKPQKEQKVSRH